MPTTPAEQTVIHVREGTPVPSLECARDELRRMASAGALERGATVLVHGGVYELTRTFALSELDSGTAEAPIRYAAAEGETVCLRGGRELSSFTAVAEPVAARLSEEARGHVVQCDLASSGVSDCGGFVSRGFSRPTSPAHLELFFRGERMEVARWPNEGFARINAPAELNPDGDHHGGALGVLESGFVYEGKRPRRWGDLSDVWMHGYWGWDWADSYERLASYDAQTGLITTHPPHGLYGFRAGQRFYFLNVLEELDRPGEYFVDTDRAILYFWPPEEIGPGDVLVSVLEEPLITFDGVRHVEISDMTLECSRGTGVEIRGGAGVELSGCTLRLVGTHAVVVEGGEGHGVRGCDISRTGDGGIRLSGGDRRTLAAAGHEADNNHISHMGQWSRCYQPAVMVSGVGQRVSHNLIHDGPHSAIQLSGNEHLIEYNHIHHVCQESGDVGAFYMGRDWTERGNVIRFNFFHHTQGHGMGSMAVYLDDCASGTTISGNVFYCCTRAAFVGGGRNNRIDNNLFVDCRPGVDIDGRGLDPRPVWRNMVDVTMRERFEAIDHRRPPYSTRYPDLRELEPFYARGEGIPPEGNLVVRNISWGGEWLSIRWHAASEIVADQFNLIDEDPLFVHPLPASADDPSSPAARSLTAVDFRLAEDSPAYELGFEALPLEQIGLYLDDARSSLPEAAQTAVAHG